MILAEGTLLLESSAMSSFESGSSRLHGHLGVPEHFKRHSRVRHNLLNHHVIATSYEHNEDQDIFLYLILSKQEEVVWHIIFLSLHY